MLGFSQVAESFTDGDYTANPVWTPSASTDFIVNGSGQLQSNNTVANSTFYISTPSTLATSTQWEFFVNLKFSTSGANYVDAFLIASAADLSASTTNGFFVRIGNTSDDISLYRKDGATSTILIDGVNSSVGSSSNNLIKIKVIRDAANQFVLYRDMTGTGTSYVSEGSITDNAYTTSTAFGFLIKQSTVASFAQKHFFDDITVQAYVPDIIPPTVQSATVISVNAIDVLFNEPLDATTAGTTANYSVNNSIGAPSTAVLDGSNTSLVHLTFAANFADAVANQLTVNGVKDIAGNAISGGTANFTYFAPYVAKQYDVVIDEIMADETPAVGLPAREWVELKNTTTSAINLKDWKIKDATGQSGLFPNYVLAPGAYVILCASTSVADLSVYGSTLAVTSFPSLNNTGEPLTLVNETGAVIHSVNYNLGWYHDVTKQDGGWTIEMINTKSPCSGISNWKASTDVKGGTPGVINSVDGGTADVTGPVLQSVIVVDNLNIKLVFNESLDSLKGATIANYSINNGLGTPAEAVTVSPGFDTVNIKLASAAVSATTYTITVSNVTDCLGNVISGGTGTFTYFAIVPANPYDVVIDEIMADETPAVGLPEREWIELKNTSNSNSFNLQGWRLKDATGQSGAFPSYILPPNSYVILCSSTSAPDLSAFGPTLSPTSFPSLNNTGEPLTLVNASGSVIHAVSYNLDWYHDASKQDGGWTLEMINTKSPCSGISNWKASTDVKGGTPGAINSVNGGTTDLTGPKLVSAFVTDPTHIVLHFDETLDSLKAATITNYSLTGGISIIDGVTVGPLFDAVNLTLSTPLTTGVEYTITAATAITDCLGNQISTDNTAKLFVASPAVRFDLVVNEILFNPLPSINAEPPGVDYVEIYNRSNKVIDLSKIYITNRSSTTGKIGTLVPLSVSGRLLQPGAFVVATEDPAIVQRDFVVKDPAAFVTVNMPSYSDDKGFVIICDADTNIIDEIRYTEKWHFKLISNRENVALERINYDDTSLVQSEQERNWHSAATSVGFGNGTPTYKNSQYRIDLQPQGDVTVDPAIFSPDNDGIDDIATLKYNFPEPGYVANITIFDASGRPVRYLQKNALCGSTGIFRWDGLGEKNQQLAIGIYVIYTEIFNLKGNKKTFKTPIVLARRN
ncbi:lamin tail domain-containing protein [Ferruginibacter lapsinanis]|uniref:lamin tail domain-containing protein n=1 Tax=Ferruginibacter lapsinanis TaxID=563172 RepID=UPI001E351C68|nr:lamin tail domain-containing protein [Ferruginibacter lapsinanis]UEG50667.1 lamin tail domain-containing protein [Ferruginibacter lapsinanis]